MFLYIVLMKSIINLSYNVVNNVLGNIEYSLLEIDCQGVSHADTGSFASVLLYL